MSKYRGCIIGSPRPCKCSSSIGPKPSTRRVKVVKSINAGGPCGGPSCRNWIAHIWQRRLHCPTGSNCTKRGSSTGRLLLEKEHAILDRTGQPPENRQQRDGRGSHDHFGHMARRMGCMRQPLGAKLAG